MKIFTVIGFEYRVFVGMYFTDGVSEMLQKNLTEAKHTVTFDSCGGELTDTEQQVYARLISLTELPK